MSKNTKLTKAMKYRIKFNKDLYDTLRDVQCDVWRIKNKATSMAWDWQQFSFGYNERFGEYPKEKDILGAVLVTDIYRELKNMGKNMSSSTYNSAVKESVDKFKEQSSRVNRGEESIATYKRNGSFPIRARQIKNIEKVNSKTFTANLSILSNVYVKKHKEELKERNVKLKAEGKEEIIPEFEIKTQLPVTLMSGKGATEIMDRIIAGEYKLCDSRIVLDRKNRFYLTVVYQFEQEKNNILDKDKIMGIDVGVKVPAYLAISDDNYYRQHTGDAAEVERFQRQMESRKRALQRSRKWAGDGSVGHGTKTRTKPLEKLSGKISRYKEHKNHVWSRYIIDEAVKNGCGTIQMEDLSGISDNNFFLKSWTFYSLQEKIRYKAQEAGIEVIMVNPQFTSARCNKCGNIHNSKNKEKWRPNQDSFKCSTCDWGNKFYVNADWNAAKNISMKNIEEIIKEQLKMQKENEKHALKYESYS